MTRTTAPLYRATECCGNCKHSDDPCGDDYYTRCSIHTEHIKSSTSIDLIVSPTDICNDFKWRTKHAV